MAPEVQMQDQYNLFVKVIVLLNALFPAFCLIGLLAGVVLILRRNRWGYYIMFVALAGIAAHMFFHS